MSTEKKYRLLVFGKTGCKKCKMLQGRIDKLLVSEDWNDFEKEYCDIESPAGLVKFAKGECINPSRIPALLVTTFDPVKGKYVAITNPDPYTRNDVCKASALHQYVGLQTDYNGEGKGVIRPEMITYVMEQARALT